MGNLLTNIGTILTSLLNWFSQIGSYLITNPIFIIILSIGIFILLFNKIKTIVNHIKWNKKYGNIDNWDIEDFDNDLEEWKKEHPNAYYDSVSNTWIDGEQYGDYDLMMREE